MLLCAAAVLSLMQECNCGVTCIVLCAQLMERMLAVNLLGIWRVTQVLQQYLQWWRISLQPSSSALCDYTEKLTHIHMPVSCLRLNLKSESFLPTFLRRPHCSLSRCFIAAWPDRTRPEKGLHQFTLSGWVFHRRTLNRSCLKHMRRDLTN